MKFKQTKTIFLLVFLLAMPSGVFASLFGSGPSQTSQVFATNAVYRPSGSFALPVVSTSVKVTMATQKFSIINTGISTFDCLSDGRNSGSMVQNSGVLNLNQPAQCFSLVIKGFSASSVHLAVQPLVAVKQKINGVISGYFMVSPKLLPAPFSQSLPVLPAAFASALALMAWTERKELKNKLKPKTSMLKTVFSLEQLQVLRC